MNTEITPLYAGLGGRSVNTEITPLSNYAGLVSDARRNLAALQKHRENVQARVLEAIAERDRTDAALARLNAFLHTEAPMDP